MKSQEQGEEQFNSQHRRKNGTCFDVEVSVKYHSHDGGTSVAFVRDITSRKQAEAELWESENRFRIMVETIPLAIRVTVSKEQTTEYLNQEFTRLFGYQLEDIPNLEQWWLLAYPNVAYRLEIREKFFKKYERSAKDYSITAPVVSAVTCKDGSKKIVEWGIIVVGNKSYSYGLDLTERKQAEDTLRVSEQRFKNIVNETPLGIHLYELDSEYNLIFCAANPAADRILGLDHTTLIGKTIEEAFPLLAATLIPEKYKDAALFGSVWRQESIDYDDGQVRGAYEFTFFQTEPGRMATMFDDITQRRQAEEALTESEKRYRLLADNVSDIIWTMNLYGKFTYFSPSVEKLRGLTPAEAMQQSLDKTFAPVSLKIALEALESIRSNVEFGIPASFLGELEEYCKDGSTIWTEVSANAIYSSDGVFEGFLGVSRDISIRRKHEAALRKSEYEFRALAESMPQIVWICTLEGLNTYFNQKWVNYTGKTLVESHGNGWLTSLHPDDLQTALNAWSNAKCHGIIYTFECRLRRTDGVYKWWLVRGKPVRDDRGSIEKWFGTCTDIDELKQSGEELRQAKTAAESASNAKSQFLANMSHEMRTPMNAVIGLARLLTETELDKTQLEYVELIEKSSKNLLCLINNILDLSKIEANKFELEIAPFDLRAEISDLLALMSVHAQEKGLQFEASIDDRIPVLLLGDAVGILQIITNLLSNAIKFTLSGSVSLVICLEHIDSNNALLRFWVKDSGIGLPTDMFEHIFEPFVQADNSSTRKFSGTGLGLSICKKNVEMMGGKIGVESCVGVGSTFWFTVTLGIPAGGVSTDQARHKRSKDRAKPNLNVYVNTRILLIEDDPVNRLVTEKLLMLAGVTVDCAINGAEALRLLSENDYPLILMDCQMPDMDGFEITTVIRDPNSPVRNHSVPIIALTANVLNGIREKCKAAGMNDYLAKPLDFESLLEILATYLAELPEYGTMVFDEANLLKRHMDDVDDVKELVRLFVVKARDYLEKFQKHLSLGNITSAQRQLHILKGAAATVGASRLASLATEVEDLSITMLESKADQILENILNEYKRVLTVLISRGWIE